MRRRYHDHVDVYVSEKICSQSPLIDWNAHQVQPGLLDYQPLVRMAGVFHHGPTRSTFPQRLANQHQSLGEATADEDPARVCMSPADPTEVGGERGPQLKRTLG